MTLSLLLLVVAAVLLALAAFTSYRTLPYGPAAGWAGLFFWVLATIVGNVHIST